MSTRGAVIVETAFVMSLVLMVLFGTLKFSVVAFTQLSQDGAAFVAARAYSEYPAAGVASAQNAAHGIFTHVPVSAVVLSPSTGAVTATVLGTAQGLPVPGTPSTFALGSVASEVVATAAGGSGSSFGVSATLQDNYTTPGDYPWQTAGIIQPRVMGIAQAFSPIAGSKYLEWYCRQAAYSALRIPTTTANGARNCYYWWMYTGCFFDPEEDFSPLDPIYDYDIGETCA